MFRYDTFINLDDEDDIPVTVHYDYYPAVTEPGPDRGRDTPARVSIDKVIDDDGRTVTLTDTQEEILKELILLQHEP